MIRNLRNILIVIAAISSGSFLGYIFGAMFGAVLGAGASLVFSEILRAQQTILMSILLSLFLGGLLGLFALQINNKLFETNDHPLVGITTGAVIGVSLVAFFYGYIDISNAHYLPDASFFDSSPFDYSVAIGSRIGAIVFPLYGAIALVREKIATSMELRKNRQRDDESKNELSFYRSKNSVDDK